MVLQNLEKQIPIEDTSTYKTFLQWGILNHAKVPVNWNRMQPAIHYLWIY